MVLTVFVHHPKIICLQCANALSGHEARSLVKAHVPVTENKNNDLYSIRMFIAREMKKNRTKQSMEDWALLGRGGVKGVG